MHLLILNAEERMRKLVSKWYVVTLETLRAASADDNFIQAVLLLAKEHGTLVNNLGDTWH